MWVRDFSDKAIITWGKGNCGTNSSTHQKGTSETLKCKFSLVLKFIDGWWYELSGKLTPYLESQPQTYTKNQTVSRKTFQNKPISISFPLSLSLALSHTHIYLSLPGLWSVFTNEKCGRFLFMRVIVWLLTAWYFTPHGTHRGPLLAQAAWCVIVQAYFRVRAVLKRDIPIARQLCIKCSHMFTIRDGTCVCTDLDLGSADIVKRTSDVWRVFRSPERPVCLKG